jgi:hypothetical protein
MKKALCLAVAILGFFTFCIGCGGEGRGGRAAPRVGGVWFLRSMIEEVKNAQSKSEIYRL